jgi:thioredoxin-dependent peroxiredoxin
VRLQPGDTAPDFTLTDQDGAPVALADYRGRRVILYFYPEAMTPGCTTEACDFRDNLNSLEAAGFAVLGVSRDSAEKLRAFREQEHLTFPLLSDADRAVHEAYGVWGEKQLYGKTVTGVLRSTFVIDGDGKVEQAFYNTKATGHVAMLRKRLGIAA